MINILNTKGFNCSVNFFKALIKKSFEDNIFNGAAALAYYWFLALFPLMVLILGLVAYIPVADLDSTIMNWLTIVLPGEASGLFQSAIEEITNNQQGGLVTFGAVTSIWIASTGFQSLMDNLNITYRVKELRPYWKSRLTSVALLFSFVFLGIGSFCLLAIRDSVQEWMSQMFGSIWILSFGFEIFRWVLLIVFILLAHSLIYYWGPNVQGKFRFISPGSLFSSTFFILSSLGLQFCIENFVNYSAVYGGLGAVIVFLLWLNVLGIFLLLGSEIDVLLEEF